MPTVTTANKANGIMLRTDSLYLDPKFAEFVETFDAGRDDVKKAQFDNNKRTENK